MTTNKLLNQIISETIIYVNEEFTGIRDFAIRFGDFDEYKQVSELLVRIVRNTDFHLVRTNSELQELYNTIRYNDGEDTGNFGIRFICGVADFILSYSAIDDFSVTELHEALADMVTVHNSVDRDKTCYDTEFLETLKYQDWVEVFKNNPWLVACVVLNKMPSIILLKMLLSDELDDKPQDIN